MKNLALCASLLLGLSAVPAQARHRHHHAGAPAAAPVKPLYSWEQGRFDLSTVDVQPYALPDSADPRRAAFLRKMNLENGVLTKGTHYITARDIRSRDLFILDITQSLEGGFDSVNLYDRGILSWGIMQWSARSGSLSGALTYVKRRLMTTGRKRVWDKVFVANGLDVNGNGLIAFGKPLRNAADMRLAFRGTLKVGQYDPKLVNHWAVAMARAGRQSDIAQLEVEYASHTVDAMLQRRLRGLPYHAPGRAGVTPADLAANDPYSEALIFVLWTNNPRHSVEYIGDAARAARSVSLYDDPALWTPGAFSDALLRRCRASRFGNWQARAEMIEERAVVVRSAPPAGLCPFEQDYQQVLAARKARRTMELASRHEAQLRVAARMASPERVFHHLTPVAIRKAHVVKPVKAKSVTTPMPSSASHAAPSPHERTGPSLSTHGTVLNP